MATVNPPVGRRVGVWAQIESNSNAVCCLLKGPKGQWPSRALLLLEPPLSCPSDLASTILWPVLQANVYTSPPLTALWLFISAESSGSVMHIA